MSKLDVDAAECAQRFMQQVVARGAPRVLCVDPGGTTGYAAVWTGDDRGGGRYIGAGQLTGHTYEQLDALMHMWVGASYCGLVVEDFQLRAGLQRGAASKAVTLEPVRIIAALEYATYRTAVRAKEHGSVGGMVARYSSSDAIRRQQAASAKTLATDARLRVWNVYVVGDHARDAVRHAVLWLHTAAERTSGLGGEVVEGLRSGTWQAGRIDR